MGDWRQLHSNTEYPGGTCFGERVAHDSLILAVAGRLTFQAGKHAVPASATAIRGVEKVRFVPLRQDT